MIQVIRMNAFRPSVSKLLVKCPSCEIQPCLAEIVAELVGPRHPDEGWSIVGNKSESRLAFTECTFCVLVFRHIEEGANRTARVAVRIKERRSVPEHVIFVSVVRDEGE